MRLFRKSGIETYSKHGRLADVIALIQSLSLNEQYVYRSEDGLQSELQGKPRSAELWSTIAQEHPEFFRYSFREEYGEKGQYRISLVSRHLLYQNYKQEEFEKTFLEPEFVNNLIKTAIDIHDRQISRSQKWTSLIPIYVALITSLFSLIAVLLRS